MRLRHSTALLAALALTLPAPASAQVGKTLSSLFGCDASGSKQVTGAAIGGVVGGVVGNRVAGDSRTLGTAVGAALGAAAGAYLGCRMQKSDQQKAEAAAREALDSNRNAAWTNPETGASGDVQMVSTTGGPATMGGLRLANGVDIASSYDVAGGRYQARSTANLRAQPSTASAIVGKLRKGDTFDALRRVTGTNWRLAGRNGVGVGYVSETVVTALAAPVQSANNLCRTFDQTVRTASGAPETQRYTACKSPNGEWIVQT